MKLMMANAGTSQYDTWEEVPADKRAEVEGRWNAMSAEDQANLLNMGGATQITAGDVFQASFSLYDILWFLLAAITAYRLGSGTATESGD
jgi:hypothetical protein